MNEDCTDLERELKSLVPREPLPRLEARIAAGLAHSSARTFPLRDWLGWRLARWAGACVAAAALLTLAVTALHKESPHRSTAPAIAPAGRDWSGFEPTRVSKVLYDSRDEGTVFGEDKLPRRLLRLRYIDAFEWTNSRTGALVQLSYPREELVAVPAFTQ